MAETAVAEAPARRSNLDDLEAIFASPTPSPTPAGRSNLDELDAIFAEPSPEPTPVAAPSSAPDVAPSVAAAPVAQPSVASKLDELEAIFSDTPATDAALKTTVGAGVAAREEIRPSEARDRPAQILAQIGRTTDQFFAPGQASPPIISPEGAAVPIAIAAGGARSAAKALEAITGLKYKEAEKGAEEAMAETLSGFTQPEGIASLLAFAVPGVADAYAVGVLSKLPEQYGRLKETIQQHGLVSKETAKVATASGIEDIMGFLAGHGAKQATIRKAAPAGSVTEAMQQRLGGKADAAKVKSTGEKVGVPEGTQVDGGAPLHERPEQAAGARREEEVGAGEEAQKAPDVSDVSVKGLFSEMGKGVTANFYEQAFEALQKGKDTIAGVKDPILSKAKEAFDAGKIKSAEDLREFANKSVSLTPNDLGTAIIHGPIKTGEILERSGIGEATPHNELKDQARARVGEDNTEATVNILNATHIFMDRAGNRLDRKQAAKALGLEGELQSEALAKLQTGGVKHVLVPSQTDKVYSGETIEEARAKAEADLNAKPGDLKGEPDYQELTDAELAQHEAKAKVQAKRTAEQEAALEESKRIDEERAAKEKKSAVKAEKQNTREQNREEARLNWDENPIVRKIIDESGGIIKESWYKKDHPETYAANKSEWDDAPEFSSRKHEEIYRRGGVLPNEAAEAVGLSTPEMWRQLGDASKKAVEALKRNKPEGFYADPEDYIPPAHVFEHGAMGAEKFGVLHGGRKPVRLANEDMDAARIGRGYEPLFRQARVGHPIQWDRAMARIDADYTAPGRLVDEVLAGEKESTSAVEQLMMLHDWIRLSNERQMEAERSQDRNESADLRKQAREKLRAHEERLHEVEAAISIAGTEAGRTLQIRQALVFDDYTLAVAMERAERTKGDELSPKEEQDVREGVDKVDATKRDWQKAKDEQSRQDAVETLAKLLKEHLGETKGEAKQGKTLLESLHSARDKALERARERRRQGRLFTGVDPEALLDATIVGASHIADGLAKLGKISKEWSNAMVRDFGEKVRPFLDQIFGLAKDYHEAARVARDKAAAEKVRAKPRKPSPIEAVEAAAEEGGGLTRRHVFDLVEEYVKAGGMTELEPIMREVTKDLQESFPGITEREVRDLFTEYGKVRFPSQEADARTMREIRRQGQLQSAIEDVAKGEAPKASGQRRDLPTQKVREMTRQLKEDMRAAGINVGMSEAKLKGSLDAIKTGLRNRIQDLTKAITERKAIVAEEKTKVPRDAEAQALTKVRDALQKEYSKIFKKRGLTEDEIIARAVKFQATKLRRMNDMIDTALAKLSVGDVKARKRGVKMDRPLPPELEAAKQELEKVNKMIEDAREALKPPPKTALEKYKAYLDKKTAELRQRIKDKNYAKPTRKKTELDNEALRKRADYTLAQRELDANIELMRLRAQGIPMKVLRGVQETARFSRSLLTSFDLSAVLAQGGMYTMAHPLRAAKIIPHMLRAMGHPTLEDIRTFIPHPIRTVKRIGTRGEQFLQMIEEEVKARPNYPKYLESKLYMSESSKLSKMEEVYMSRLQKHVPVVAASGRAFNAFLTRMRADAWDALAESLPFGREPTKEEALAISNAINVMSGRGSLGEGGKAAQVAAGLNGWLFAPRLAYSRFETILGQPVFGKRARAGGPAVQKLIAKEYGRAFLGASVILALGLLAGATIEPDPRSSDFGKLKFGNTRVDVFWGLLPATVFLARAITGKLRKIPPATKPGLGPKVDLRRGEVKNYALGDLGRDFIRNKLAPVPGAMWDASEIIHHRKPPPGHGQTLSEIGVKLTIPINGGDVFQAIQDQGIARGTALGVLSTFGARLGTYQERQTGGDAGFPKMRRGSRSSRISP